MELNVERAESAKKILSSHVYPVCLRNSEIGFTVVWDLVGMCIRGYQTLLNQIRITIQWEGMGEQG